MQRLTVDELDALEAALAKASPGRFVVADGATGRELAEVQAIAAGMNALPALLAELRELRRKVGHMRRFAASMVDDGHPALLGFAYQIQVILDALPPPAPRGEE